MSTLVDELKSIQRTARDATRAVRDLEREAGGDVFGRYVIEKGEPIDEDIQGEVIEFLNHARHLYPNQELTIILVARVTEPGREDRENGESRRSSSVQR